MPAVRGGDACIIDITERRKPLETGTTSIADGTSQAGEANAVRMARLAVLPVFINLSGKRAVIAGGSAAAAWKAELLAAAGAEVEIYAALLSTEMTGLLSNGGAAGTVSQKGSRWSPEALAGAAIALLDADDDAEAASFSQAARGAGVLCNVIDKPAFGDFQFGTIVNRSPIVVGISTDGAAPILGQTIRRRIEVLLPPSLAAWGQLAKAVRGRVSSLMAVGPRRRAFWEKFAERAFAAPPTDQSLAELEAEAGEIASDGDRGQGRLTIVGAGPGDADLLTLKGMRALQAASVIFHDDRVSTEVLERARREATRIAVDTRRVADGAGQYYGRLMRDFALEGKNVVYLRSDDAVACAVADDALSLLSSAGVPTDIVPGITTPAAAAAGVAQ